MSSKSTLASTASLRIPVSIQRPEPTPIEAAVAACGQTRFYVRAVITGDRVASKDCCK
jgi:hypothetical protein